MNKSDRIERLERIQKAKKWPGRLTIIYGKDSVSVIETDRHGNRTESEVPVNEFIEPEHPNILIITGC